MLCGLLTQLHAGGDVIAIEDIADTTAVEVPTEHETEGAFYVIVKGLTISGETIIEEDSTLDGDRGYGFGIDIGYRLGKGFALEYDFSYATNTVKETDEHNHIEEAEGVYYTHALDIVYTHHVSHSIGVFLKAGYEYEIEKIDDFHIDSTAHGAILGLGFEIAMNEHYKFVLEAEKSMVDSARGSSLFAGIMYNF